MYAQSINIDWLTLTKKYPQDYAPWESGNDVATMILASFVLNELDIVPYAISPQPGMAQYKYAWKEEASGVIVYVPLDIERQGVMVHMPGSVNREAVNPINLLAIAVDKEWHCTRIDIAADFHGTGLKPEFIHHLYGAYHPRATRNTTLITGVNGSTFYIGSRKSDRMMRVYDKGAQQKTGEDWLRVEAEYKGHLTAEVVKQTLVNIGGVAADMRRMLDLPMLSLDVLLEMFTIGDETHVKGRQATRGDREAWLMTSVISAVRKLAGDDYDAACRFRDAVVQLLADGDI